MRTVIFSLLLLCFVKAQAQPLADTASVRINRAALELEKAAWCHETSIWWGVFGSVFTMLASDRSAKVYDHNLAVGLGVVTVGGFATLQIIGAKKQKRAARLLHL